MNLFNKKKAVRLILDCFGMFGATFDIEEFKQGESTEFDLVRILLEKEYADEKDFWIQLRIPHQHPHLHINVASEIYSYFKHTLYQFNILDFLRDGLSPAQVVTITDKSKNLAAYSYRPGDFIRFAYNKQFQSITHIQKLDTINCTQFMFEGDANSGVFIGGLNAGSIVLLNSKPEIKRSLWRKYKMTPPNENEE